MLSVFPYFLSWNQISPFLIRIVLGLVFLYSAYKVFKGSSASMQAKSAGIIEFVAGILLIIGLWTQVAAIVIGIDLIIRLIGKIQKKSFMTDGVNYYLVLLILAFSLLVTGAGFLAFDMPL